MVTDEILLLPMIYSLLLRCCLHGNHNVLIAALEALSVLLRKPVTSFIIWLTTEMDQMIPLHPISSHSNMSEDVSKPTLPSFSDDDVFVTSSPSGSDSALPRDDDIVPTSPSDNRILLSSTINDNDLPSPSSSTNGDTPSHSSDNDESILSSCSDNNKTISDDTLLTPCDDHFVVSLSTTDASVSISLASAHPTSATPLLSCDFPSVDVTALQLPWATTCRTPTQVLLQLLGTRLLRDHIKVSVKAVAMQCIVAIAMWSPQQLLFVMEMDNKQKFIELLLPYMEFDDPKLCGNCCQVLSYFIKGMLIWDTSNHVISMSSALDQLVKVLSGNSAMVLHAAIPSVQVRLYFHGYYVHVIYC